MPLYPVKNLKTGETQELMLSIAQYEEWRKENPDWDKDWSKGCAMPGEAWGLAEQVRRRVERSAR